MDREKKGHGSGIYLVNKLSTLAKINTHRKINYIQFIALQAVLGVLSAVELFHTGS